MKLTDLLKGRKVNVKTEVGVTVELEIESVEEGSKRHTHDLEASTKDNDWWPAQSTWTETWVTVKFTNGHSKRYNNLEEIELATP